MSGTIPSNLVHENIDVLTLSKNNLSGSIPEAILRSKSLRVMSLHSNLLTGTISGIYGNLTNINLYGNFFSGPVPFNASAMAMLKKFNVQDNQFTGTIPIGFVHCTEMNKCKHLFSVLQQVTLICFILSDFTTE